VGCHIEAFLAFSKAVPLGYTPVALEIRRRPDANHASRKLEGFAEAHRPSIASFYAIFIDEQAGLAANFLCQPKL